jgi:hypothetical protein
MTTPADGQALRRDGLGRNRAGGKVELQVESTPTRAKSSSLGATTDHARRTSTPST